MHRLTQLFCFFFILNSSCKNSNDAPIVSENETNAPLEKPLSEPVPLTQEFKNYWYGNEAEITSYKLEQARYGEMREGSAVLIYVTEPFLRDEQVKADKSYPSNIPVLKLNSVKKFNTGIYPYSIMQSVFYPVANNQHALKISCSVQEWCGHVYTQLNNHTEFEVTSHSYFEGEEDEDFSLDKIILENELWTQIRVDPKTLPTGDIQLIPSFDFMRLRHIPMKSYPATAKMTDGTYSISYPDLHRSLKINFNTQFPYEISGWEETFISGFGEKAKELTTKATKIKTIKSDYWNKNTNADSGLRETLGIK